MTKQLFAFSRFSPNSLYGRKYLLSISLRPLQQWLCLIFIPSKWYLSIFSVSLLILMFLSFRPFLASLDCLQKCAFKQTFTKKMFQLLTQSNSPFKQGMINKILAIHSHTSSESGRGPFHDFHVTAFHANELLYNCNSLRLGLSPIFNWQLCSPREKHLLQL